MKEADFQRQVLQLAQTFGWRTAHFRACMNQRGKWQTAIAGDAKGFPDLVLIRDRVIFAELKTDKGTVRPEQKQWAARLSEAHAEYYLWRPRDWDFIVETLKHKS